LYGIKIWTDLSSVLSQCTHLTDRLSGGQTDRILIARPRLHSMQRGKNCQLILAVRIRFYDSYSSTFYSTNNK